MAIWEDSPFGPEILLAVKRDDGCPIAYHYQWEKEKLLQVFFFPKFPSNLILLDFWRYLVLQRPWIGWIGKWELARTGQWRAMSLEGGYEGHPPDGKHLSSDHLVIPGLYNFQPACQCVVMLYKAFWMGKSGMKKTEDKWHLQSCYWKGAGLLRILLILVTVLLRDCRCSLAFMLISWHPTSCVEWRKVPFFLLDVFPLKELEFYVIVLVLCCCLFGFGFGFFLFFVLFACFGGCDTKL